MNHAIKILATALLCGLGLVIGSAVQRQEDVPAALATGSTTEVTLVDTDFDTDPVGSLPAPLQFQSSAFAINPVVEVTDELSLSGAHSLELGKVAGRAGWRVPLPEHVPLVGLHVTVQQQIGNLGSASRSFLGLVGRSGDPNDRDFVTLDLAGGMGGGPNSDWILPFIAPPNVFSKIEMIWDFTSGNLVVQANGVEVYNALDPDDGIPIDHIGTGIPAYVESYVQGALSSDWVYQDDVEITMFLAPDIDEDGMGDGFESGFGGTDPSDSLVITNPETDDQAESMGSAANGATIYSGSFDIVLPPDTSVDTGGGADHIAITLDPTLPARLAVTGADLAGGTKSVVMPFDGDASAPAVCIDDSATATVDSVLAGGECDGTLVAIPAAVGGSNVSGAFTVTRLSSSPPRVRVDGLSHTALATIALGVPGITSVTSATAPAMVGTSVTASADFYDTDGDTSSATFTWGDGTTSAGTIQAGTATGSHVYTATGVYTVGVTLTDGAGHSASGSYRYVVVYNPNGGFVTGGGWINSPAGAYAGDPTLSGKATFGFVAKYKPGKTVPEGNTEFQFKAGNLNFKSTDYAWLVVSGKKAKYRGWGTVNGSGHYEFMLTATDGSPDLFRIKIWDCEGCGGVLYDNKTGASDDGYEGTAIGGGSIQIQKS